MRARLSAISVIISLLLSGCDNFQGFVVQNPCSFDVSVAFAGTDPPPDQDPWPYPETISGSSEKHVVTGAPAGDYPHEQRVQIRAPGHKTVVETIAVSEDDLTWQIPKSFCFS
jgi:hypothetical protein